MGMRSGVNQTENRYQQRMDVDIRREEAERRGKEIEPVCEKFLATVGKHVFEHVRRATEQEDHDKIDFVVTLKNGKLITLQLTCAESKEIQLEKIAEMMYQPAVGMLYPKEAPPQRLEEPAIRVVIFARPQKWDKALENFKNGKDPEAYFPNAHEELDFILDQIYLSLQHLFDAKPDLRSVILPQLSYFKSALVQ